MPTWFVLRPKWEIHSKISFAKYFDLLYLNLISLSSSKLHHSKNTFQPSTSSLPPFGMNEKCNFQLQLRYLPKKSTATAATKVEIKYRNPVLAEGLLGFEVMTYHSYLTTWPVAHSWGYSHNHLPSNYCLKVRLLWSTLEMEWILWIRKSFSKRLFANLRIQRIYWVYLLKRERYYQSSSTNGTIVY